MRREEVRPLLEAAVSSVPEPDLADAAWADGLAQRSRRRRSTAVVLVVVVFIAVVAAVLAGMGGGNSGLVPPTTPPTLPGYVPPAGQIAGIDYWVAPPGGSERFLDRAITPLGHTLRLPDNPGDLKSEPLERIAAVVLSEREGLYEPLLLGSDALWARTETELVAIAIGPPLSSGAVSPNGRLAAFPQPGSVVVIDATDATVRRITVPALDLRAIAWLPDSRRLLVSGPGIVYRLLVDGGGSGEETVVLVETTNDPYAASAPYRLDGVAGQVTLSRYTTSSGWTHARNAQLPVGSWFGQTFAAGSHAARLFLANQLQQVPGSPAQVVAAIAIEPSQPSRLLVLAETPAASPTPPIGRATGCCYVLGWYDEYTVMVKVQGWLLAWDIRLGQVRRISELEVSPVALGPGIRG